MDLNYDDIKILVVGAGGIGCELLKNLILTGFKNIEVIDLDTIELSNLNRQFLFQKCHVGKPKAIIARESVLKYNPNANIIAYHDSIMNPKYNVDYFKQFSIVLNALDNKAARSHVNRLCLAADIPLVESGSAGYLGQVTLIKKSFTECYDCLPKPPTKTFPGCTIRNTPSEPIHCIVWAKHLFNQLFGAEDPDEAVSPDGEDPENMAEAGQSTIQKLNQQQQINRVSTRQWAKDTKYDAVKLFNKLFNDDIKYLLSMSKLWEKRKPPTPLDWSECLLNEGIPNQEEQSNNFSSLKLWSKSECCKVFQSSINNLYARLKNDQNQVLYWDKDDEDAMNFVSSSANLRCFIFSIQIKSKFEIKSLAGNIIPAIATTNAIVAGLIVLEALKVLKNKLSECKAVYLRDKPLQNKLIVASELVKSNPKCYVCASKPEITIKLNLNTFTCKQFESKILKQELNMVQPDVEIDDGSGRIIISSEEGETEDNNDKPLSIFGLLNQSRLKCDDFFQNYELNIILLDTDKIDSKTNSKDYEIITDSQLLKDIQTQVEKDNIKHKEFEAKKALENETDILILNHEDKKRTYEAAFKDEDVSNKDASSLNGDYKCTNKKLKSSDESNQAVDQDEILCSSNSINDASDAISDEEDSTQQQTKITLVQPKPVDKNTIPEEDEDEILIEEDNEILIEESSSDKNENLDSIDDTVTYNHKKLKASLIKNSNGINSNISNNNHINNNEQDDDIIECTSEQDIIELNDDEESQSRQNGLSNSDFNSNQSEPVWSNGKSGLTDESIDLCSNKSNTNLNNENDKNQPQSITGQESEDGITIIE